VHPPLLDDNQRRRGEDGGGDGQAGRHLRTIASTATLGGGVGGGGERATPSIFLLSRVNVGNGSEWGPFYNEGGKDRQGGRGRGGDRGGEPLAAGHSFYGAFRSGTYVETEGQRERGARREGEIGLR